MILFRASAIVLMQLGIIPVAYSQRELNATASPGNTIHIEEDLDLSYDRDTIVITSDVPVTIQRYNEAGAGKFYVEGQQPVTADMGKVLITSNCDTSQTEIDPAVAISSNGDITITLPGVSNEEAADMPFLDPSSYSAMWTWVSGWCSFQQTAPPVFVNDGVDGTTKCETSSAANPFDGCATEGEFCQLKMEVCNNDEVTMQNGLCVSAPDMCIEIYQPVCGCDGNDYGNECKASSAGVSVSRMGVCRESLSSSTVTPLQVKPVPADDSSTVGLKCEIGPMADPSNSCETKGEFCQLGEGICGDNSGSYSGICTLPSQMCATIYEPVCGCDGKVYGNECSAYGAGVSISHTGECSKAATDAPGTLNTKCETGPMADPDNGCETKGEFCQLGEGICGDNRGSYNGVCQAIPDMCMEIYEPVCGCDGKVYSNECYARAAGVSVDSVGECNKTPPITTASPPATTVVSDLDGCPGNAPCLTSGGVCAEIVQCFVSPCDVNTCGENERCLSNYCGGCSFECIPNLFNENTAVQTTVVKPSVSTEKLLCEVGQTCSEAGSYCTIGEESCCGRTYPSFRCDCADRGDGQLEYSFCMYTDSCMVPPCCIPGPPADKPPPAEEMCQTGELCDTGIQDDYCCYDIQGGMGSYCSKSGGIASDTTSTTAAVTTTSLMEDLEDTKPTNSPTEVQTLNPSDAPTSNPSDYPTRSPIKAATTTEATAATGTTTALIEETGTEDPTPNPSASPIKEATTTVATTVSSTTEASTDSTSTSIAEFAPVDGDFPTEAPSTKPSTEGSKPPTLSPTTWWQRSNTGSDGAMAPNSAFNRSFSFCIATTLSVIVAISVIFPGNGGGNNFWGFGKLAVAAVAVSSVYPKSSVKNSNIRKMSRGRKSPLHSQTKRALQTCSFNVEVLIDSCTKSVEINAPAGRVIELSSIDNQMAQQRPDDECTTDYNATLDFSVTDDTVVLDLEENNTYAAYDQWSFQCARAVAGRPFVDDKGGSLQATPCVPSDEFKSTALSWTGEALMEIQASHVGNATDRDRFLMGEDWTQRALGEHASVASFSAFSIALMTNHAPSDLVNDALMAGMDEVRHAKVSFDIASRLTGKDVGPGPLPPSSHEFGQDLGALALAVAREGCVDETLSTFAAAMEVEHINQVLEKGMQDDLYANIGRDMLTLIRDELVTIAMDESNHSALAWRTLGWVCGADSNACDSVYTDVFEESNLEMRFKQRAHALFGEKSTVLSSMRGEWMKIFNAHQLAHSGLSVCKKSNTAGIWEDESGQGLLTSVTENVVRQVLCR